MNNSRSIEEILREIRDAYSETRRSDDARSGDNAAVVPSGGSKSTWSSEETRWHIDQLTVVWPSSNPKR